MKSKKIVVLFGGSGDERMVSVASAQNLAQILPDATLWFQDQQGSIFEVSADEVIQHQRPFESPFTPRAKALFPSLSAALDKEKGEHVFFLGFHGGDGEDGTVQAQFEKRGLPFTGSGSQASATAFNKQKTKECATKAGVRVAFETPLTARSKEQCTQALKEIIAKYGGVVVKPVAGGSSVGLHKIRTESEIPKAVEAICAEGAPAYFAEEMLVGPELTVGVLERNGTVEPLPPSEVRTDAGMSFDYAGKYLGIGTKEITPAEQPPEIIAAAQKLALTVHKALGCRGYSRTDVIMTKTGPVLLEINTLPGLTKASFIPQQLTAAKISMLDFIHGQVEIACRD